MAVAILRDSQAAVFTLAHVKNRVEHMQVWELEGNVQEMHLDQSLLPLMSVKPLSEVPVWM